MNIKAIARKIFLATKWQQIYVHISALVRGVYDLNSFRRGQKCSQFLVSYPMELIHLDFLTLGGKAGHAKSTNILVITDHFTKYAQAYITPKQTAIVVVHTLWENILGTLWMSRENTY